MDESAFAHKARVDNVDDPWLDTLAHNGLSLFESAATLRHWDDKNDLSKL